LNSFDPKTLFLGKTHSTPGSRKTAVWALERQQKEELVKLVIVWRNPNPKPTPRISIHCVSRENRVAVYWASSAEAIERFEMILGGAA
jgi:hypothetical protein